MNIPWIWHHLWYMRHQRKPMISAAKNRSKYSIVPQILWSGGWKKKTRGLRWPKGTTSPPTVYVSLLELLCHSKPSVAFRHDGRLPILSPRLIHLSLPYRVQIFLCLAIVSYLLYKNWILVYGVCNQEGKPQWTWKRSRLRDVRSA